VHELGITQGIIDRAREAAAASGGVRVTDLFLTMTPLADFSQDSIEMYFEMLTQDDEFFAGAELHFTHEAVAATCLSCSDEFTTDAPQPVCPQCGSLTVSLDPDAPMVQLTDVGIDEGTGEGSGGP
jgi:Zn finger protein HypA/HybF involved in hydrogenase expression